MTKKKELSELQQRFLDVLFDQAEGNIRQAMDLAGYSKNTRVSDVLKGLSEEITELALRHLSSSSARAVFGLLSVLENPNQLGASNKLKAAQQVLDRAGVLKRSEDISLKVPETGIVILPAKRSAYDSDESKKQVTEDVEIEDVKDTE